MTDFCSRFLLRARTRMSTPISCCTTCKWSNSCANTNHRPSSSRPWKPLCLFQGMSTFKSQRWTCNIIFTASRTVDPGAVLLGTGRTDVVVSIGQKGGDVSLRQLWDVRRWGSVLNWAHWNVRQNERRYSKYLYNISGSVIHAQHSSTAAVAVTFGAEFFAVTGPTEELVVVLGRVRAVQHLFAVGCQTWKKTIRYRFQSTCIVATTVYRKQSTSCGTICQGPSFLQQSKHSSCNEDKCRASLGFFFLVRHNFLTKKKKKENVGKKIVIWRWKSRY